MFAEHIVDEVDEAAGVAPFVVVPGEYFDEVAGGADDGGAEAVDDGGVWVADDVDGDEWFFGVFHDAAESVFGCSLESGVEVLFGDFFVQEGGEVGQGSIGGGDAQGESVEFSFEFGDD